MLFASDAPCRVQGPFLREPCQRPGTSWLPRDRLIAGATGPNAGPSSSCSLFQHTELPLGPPAVCP